MHIYLFYIISGTHFNFNHIFKCYITTSNTIIFSLHIVNNKLFKTVTFFLSAKNPSHVFVVSYYIFILLYSNLVIKQNNMFIKNHI